MNPDVNEPVHGESASQYDEEVKAYSSYGHEVIFGMGFEFVRAGEKLLDIGIGTGLASINFSGIGLKVYGLDNSRKMLDACRSKMFTEELVLCDVTREAIPYEDNFFDHVICCGVLHFWGDMEALFSEVCRVLRSGGIFAFSIAPQETTSDYIHEPTAWGVPIFRHAPGYIAEMLEANGMELLKEQRLMIKGADKVHFDMLFSVLISRRA